MTIKNKFKERNMFTFKLFHLPRTPRRKLFLKQFMMIIGSYKLKCVLNVVYNTFLFIKNQALLKIGKNLYTKIKGLFQLQLFY